MSEEINTNPMSSLSCLISASKEAERDMVKLDAFAGYLRDNMALISKYKGVCESLKAWLEGFNSSQTFCFETIIAKLNRLLSLTEQIKNLRSMLKKCEPFPELHDKGKVVEQAKAVCDRCEQEMTLEEIERGSAEVEQSIAKVQLLLDSFSDDEAQKQLALTKRLDVVSVDLEEAHPEMWEDDYSRISKRLDFYKGRPGLSDSIVESLDEEVRHAVASRKETISSVEEAHPVLMRNRHISDDYYRVRSCARTKAEYDRWVSELMERLREIRRENWKKTFKVIGKVLLYTIGILFVIIRSIFKLFFNHNDD